MISFSRLWSGALSAPLTSHGLVCLDCISGYSAGALSRKHCLDGILDVGYFDKES
jgi:hypothetical protein